METLQSPVVIVTGASSGIGKAASRRLFGSGFRVVLAARRARTTSVTEIGAGTGIAADRLGSGLFKSSNRD